MGDSALVLAKSASDTPRISGGKAGSTSILRPFFFAAWVRITRASALGEKPARQNRVFAVFSAVAVQAAESIPALRPSRCA